MRRLAGLSITLLLLVASFSGGQKPGIATSQSPHGNLNIPCQNCHTAQGWKPIRAVPEFDHNTTSYPLRGMHIAVACVSCHVKPVFSNVGKKCQDCHADIHKRTLGANCEQCHSVRGWNVAIKDIQAHNNRFPLTGAHAAVDCDACHKNAGNSKFQTMSTNCLSCHMKDFKGTTNPNHVAGGVAFQAPCESCHSTDNWQGAKFDHSATGFLLTGGHAVPPATCEGCHVNNNYNLGPTACVGCHMPQFTGAKNPDHVAGHFAQTCETCHTTVAWQPATFDHSKTAFPLTGAHTSTPCASCHVNNNYQITVTTCVSCHLDKYKAAKAPDHVAGGIPQTCELCHNTGAWQPAKFDHATTGWALTGAHTSTACASCHVNNNYNITVTTCVSCHLDKYKAAKAPDHVAGGISQTCELCHNTGAWQPAKFDHATTGWALTGAHASTACASCHVNNNYNITVTTCVSCHLDKYQAAKAPDHVAGGFPQNCELCHNTGAWQPATFDHATTGFPLTGAHTTTTCALCHTNNNYNITVTTCVSCHLDKFQSAKNPDHVAGGFAQTCEICHNTTAWQPASFDHSKSAFPLTGAHAATACALCHVNNNYQITVITCVSCHLDKYQAAKAPDHVAGGYPQTCEACHNTTAWQPASFDHATTGWPLTGAHTATPCGSCHTNNNYNLTVTTCVSCHLDKYQSAKAPDHVASKFSQTCESCHNTTAWQPALFDHATTGWPLTGAHTATPCASCHTNNNYNLSVTTCVSCHLDKYQTAKAPDHVAGGIPTTCELCHNTSAWQPAKFDHATTGWPLTGFHQTTACALCHVNNNYNITVTTCVSCHLPNYQGAKAPDHVAGGFPQTCELCHNTTAWQPATFDHATTGWPLTGFHLTTSCALCHTNNNYNITVTTCVSCHLANYQGAKAPDHVAGAFPQTCELCHNTTAWQPAKFDHATTGWPLTGTHVTTACALCHVNNNYNITVTACVSCHLAAYQTAKTPVDHTGFPQTCEQCHDTTVWTNGKFDHAATGWPLIGTHLTTPCASCHKNNNYNITVTTCISCHQTDFNGATSPVPHTGFPTTCELCHDTIHWTDATFNHNNTPFPLTGFHATTPCASCHVNNNYTTLPLTCIGCHLTTYNNTTNPGHAAQPTFFPSAQCSTCHNTTAWLPAVFNHTQYTRFSTGHGNANGVCATCHTNSNDYSIFQCTRCHGGDNPNNFNHPQVNGYVYNSVNCYQCHSGG